jgi:hypothetical protein
MKEDTEVSPEAMSVAAPAETSKYGKEVCASTRAPESAPDELSWHGAATPFRVHFVVANGINASA